MSGHFIVVDTAAAAEAMQAQVDAATGYSHGETLHAIGIERHATLDLWALPVVIVTAWTEGEGHDAPWPYDMNAASLSPEQRAQLKSFDDLVAMAWWGLDE